MKSPKSARWEVALLCSQEVPSPIKGRPRNVLLIDEPESSISEDAKRHVLVVLDKADCVDRSKTRWPLHPAPCQFDEPELTDAATPETTVVAFVVKELTKVARRNLALDRGDRALGFISLVLPARIRNEDIGDAMEVLHRLKMEKKPAWQVYLKLVSTILWVMWATIIEVEHALVGKKKGG
jgi:hypothetical protein